MILKMDFGPRQDRAGGLRDAYILWSGNQQTSRQLTAVPVVMATAGWVRRAAGRCKQEADRTSRLEMLLQYKRESHGERGWG